MPGRGGVVEGMLAAPGTVRVSPCPDLVIRYVRVWVIIIHRQSRVSPWSVSGAGPGCRPLAADTATAG